MSGAEAHGVSALRRDAVTRLGYTTLSVWAWFLYGFGAVLPLLRAEEGTSRTVMGLHSLAMAGGGFVAGLTTVAVVRRQTRRGAFGVGAALVAAGVVGFVLARDPILTVTAAGVAGVGGSTLLNAVVPVLTEHHGPDAAAALSEGNAVAAVIGLVAPLAVGAAVGLGFTWRPAVVLMLPLLGVVMLVLGRVPAGVVALDGGGVVRVAGASDGGDGGDGDPHRRHAAMSATAWAYLLTVVAGVGVEFCCTAWSADLLRTRTHLSAATASLGVTAVVAGLAVGRLGLGRLALRIDPRRLLAVAMTLTVAGWLVVWTTTTAVVALAGLLIAGLGIGAFYPLGASLLLASTPGQADRTTGRMSLGISVAAGGGPFALGAVADATSTHTAFVAVPLLVAVAAAALTTAVRLPTPSP